MPCRAQGNSSSKTLNKPPTVYIRVSPKCHQFIFKRERTLVPNSETLAQAVPKKSRSRDSNGRKTVNITGTYCYCRRGGIKSCVIRSFRGELLLVNTHLYSSVTTVGCCHHRAYFALLLYNMSLKHHTCVVILDTLIMHS